MIYCVEDDDSSRELMVYTLKASGFAAEGFPAAASFWGAVQKEKPELILLDIMLPDEDGITILKKLREYTATADIPVMMVSAKGTEYDKVKGLDLGADDYLAKPFGMMELISRIKALLRRSERHPAQVMRVGGIELDTGAHTAKADGEQINLTLKEYELLKLLMEGAGHVYTRDQILKAVWNTDFAGETRTVDVHVGTLRTKLKSQGSLIRTVRGVGYKMEKGKL